MNRGVPENTKLTATAESRIAMILVNAIVPLLSMKERTPWKFLKSRR